MCFFLNIKTFSAFRVKVQDGDDVESTQYPQDSRIHEDKNKDEDKETNRKTSGDRDDSKSDEKRGYISPQGSAWTYEHLYMHTVSLINSKF